jgi:glucose uptake protein GlcU
MIQRIQTIWLLLAAAAAFLTLQFPFYSGQIVEQGQPKQYIAFTAQNNMLLLILTAGLGLAALIAVFLFRNRKLQMRIILIALAVSVLNLVLYFLQTKKFIPAESNYSLAAILALAIPIFLILAARGVRKDEKLVKSLDRLR